MSIVRRRSRSAALLLGLMALIVPGAVAPVAAQDSPEAAVNGLLDTIAAGEFDRVGDYVCEQYRDAVVSQFDLSAAFEGLPGVDPQAFLDAITFRVEDRSVEVLSQDAESAVVSVSATIAGDVDEAAAREFVRALLEASGQEVTDAAVDAFLPMVTDSLAAGSQLSTQADVVLEGGRWLVCDDLGDAGTPGASTGPAASPVAADGNLCDLARLDELASLDGPSFAAADDTVAGYCTYLTGDSDAFSSLSLASDPGITDIATLQQVFPEADSLTVAGYPALFADGTLYVVTEQGTLFLSANLSEPGASGQQLTDYLASVAEVAIPRFVAGQP